MTGMATVEFGALVNERAASKGTWKASNPGQLQFVLSSFPCLTNRYPRCGSARCYKPQRKREKTARKRPHFLPAFPQSGIYLGSCG
jgi:hypothetical protein